MTFTQRAVEQLATPAAETIFWCKDFPGLGLRVSPKGRKAFICQYQVKGGKERQETLGTLTFMTVAQARELAQERRFNATKGIDPVAEKRASKATAEVQRKADQFTLEKLVDRYRRDYMAHKNRGQGAVSKNYLLDHWLRVYGDRPANAISETDVRKVKDNQQSTCQGDKLIGALRHMYGWALERRLVTHNPAKDIVKEYSIVDRERFLDHEEIKKFWHATDHHSIGWPASPIFKLLLLTGCREREIGEMKWTELNLEKRTLSLPGERTKNGRPHVIHLSDLALEILQAQEEKRTTGCDFVFSLNGRAPFRNYTECRQRISKVMGVSDWVTHDLRRTCVTLMAEIGVPHHVADKVLNHVKGKITGVAAVYNRFEYLEERRDALDKLARKITQLTGRNVVPLRAAE